MGSEAESLEQVATGAYLFDDMYHLLETAEGDTMKTVFDDLYENYDIKVLSSWYFGTRHFTSNTEMKTAEDFAGLKIRVSNAPLYLEIVKAMGGTATPMALSEVYLGFQQKAIDWVNQLQEYHPYWIKEPTSTYDILAHAAIRKAVHPIKVATGEAVQSRIIFKQLLQAGAIDVMQIDSTRVVGVNENVANLPLAARFDTPVCPHAGGVGLCELVQHFSFFDYAAISGSMEDRVIEFVDHLHEHFTEPAIVSNGRYQAPKFPGVGAQMLEQSTAHWAYPVGAGWQELNDR